MGARRVQVPGQMRQGVDAKAGWRSFAVIRSRDGVRRKDV
jgi:hypothetical protein